MMFAAGMGLDFEEGEGLFVVREFAEEAPGGFGRKSVFNNAIFDGDVAVQITTKRRGDGLGIDGGMIMNDGEIGFLDVA